mmetsp:Transcript_48328/g.121734  ORF Transcript_48328/g.121734 Transcript_48328/m.121734 type:complete len:223 (-) Transcript_48328:12-680(-)
METVKAGPTSCASATFSSSDMAWMVSRFSRDPKSPLALAGFVVSAASAPSPSAAVVIAASAAAAAAAAASLAAVAWRSASARRRSSAVSALKTSTSGVRKASALRSLASAASSFATADASASAITESTWAAAAAAEAGGPLLDDHQGEWSLRRNDGRPQDPWKQVELSQNVTTSRYASTNLAVEVAFPGRRRRRPGAGGAAICTTPNARATALMEQRAAASI